MLHIYIYGNKYFDMLRVLFTPAPSRGGAIIHPLARRGGACRRGHHDGD